MKKAIGLYSGIGGWTLGFKMASIDVIESYEWWEDANYTYSMNFGKKAGYFFIREFKEDLGERYHSFIKNMGVDLRLIELQNEVYGIDSSKYTIKEDSSSNIAYVKKED